MMIKVITRLQSRRASRKGQTMLEYVALVLALVVIGFAAFQFLGGSIVTIAHSFIDSITS